MSDKFGDHRHCDDGGMFLICHVISCDHMFKRLCTYLALFGLGQVEKENLIFHKISKETRD